MFRVSPREPPEVALGARGGLTTQGDRFNIHPRFPQDCVLAYMLVNRLNSGGAFGVLQRAEQYRADEGEDGAHNYKIERSDQRSHEYASLTFQRRIPKKHVKVAGKRQHSLW